MSGPHEQYEGARSTESDLQWMAYEGASQSSLHQEDSYLRKPALKRSRSQGSAHQRHQQYQQFPQQQQQQQQHYNDDASSSSSASGAATSASAASRSSRARVSMACIHCRKRKIRCDDWRIT
ncbi:hypothetical protein CBS101457_001989 [Exobasidium rhododendri]|nr:hypothetical protein CBS101457_001989 [Exobasidium rhododendri]